MVDEVLLKLVLLISATLLAGTAYAVETEDINTNFSGFLYNTTFSDNDFHDNRTILALNGSIDIGQFAIRGQVNTSDTPLRRLVLEYSIPVTQKDELTYQVGRFSRVDSFSNAILDSPAASQMAMLPLGGYSYRMFNGSFVLMDGHQLQLSHKTSTEGIASLRLAHGKMVLDNQQDVQKEVMKKYDPLIELKPDNKSYDVGLHYETKNWHMFASQNYYQGHSEVVQKDRLHRIIANQYHEMDYTLTKFGIKYEDGSYLIRTEYGRGQSMFHNMAGQRTAESNAKDFNFVVGKYVDSTLVYFGRSVGFNMSANTKNEDMFVGATHNWNSRWVSSLEFHEGEGRGWAKYNAPQTNDLHWHSWVLSTTYRF